MASAASSSSSASGNWGQRLERNKSWHCATTTSLDRLRIVSLLLSLSDSLSQSLRSSAHFFFTYSLQDSLRQILKIYLTLDPINKNRLTLNDPQFTFALTTKSSKTAYNSLLYLHLPLLFFFLQSCFSSSSSSCSTLVHWRATIWQNFSQMHHWMHGVFED